MPTNIPTDGPGRGLGAALGVGLLGGLWGILWGGLWIGLWGGLWGGLGCGVWGRPKELFHLDVFLLKLTHCENEAELKLLLSLAKMNILWNAMFN